MRRDLTGPAEARLIALERRLIALDRSLSAMTRQLRGVGQGLWDAWGSLDITVVGQGPPPDGVTAFPNVCPLIPFNLPITDGFYGDLTLSWDGTSAWRGCRLVNYPGSSQCAPVVGVPVFYTLFGDNTTSSWVLQVAWTSSNTGGAACPTSGSCSNTPNSSAQVTATFHCPLAGSSWGFAGAAQGSIYPQGAFPEVSVNTNFLPCSNTLLPDTLYARDSVYGSITLSRSGPNWIGCKSVNFPGYGACPPVAGAAVWYILSSSGHFTMQWKSSTPNTSQCPVASSCSDTPNVIASQSSTVTVNSCFPSFSASQSVGAGGGFIIYGNAALNGVTIDFSDQPL